jgi:carbamoyltransferase
MNILGISAFYHDSAAALVRDGQILAAAQEERFTRKKHDYVFPSHAIEYCLEEANLQPSQLDFVVFYEKPLLKFDRLIETYFSFSPVGFRSFCQAMPLWLREKLHMPKTLDKGLNGKYKGRYVFTDHHESHAASAFFPSPFQEAAIVTVDGVGEWATATIGVGRDNRIQLLQELRFPHSLGLLYSAFTYYTGFKVNSGEYKLMGLAPYGSPLYAEKIKRFLVDAKPDGSFRMNMRYFNYCQGLTMTNDRFHRLFGAPPRKPESPITQFHMDVAASIQEVTEEIMLAITNNAHKISGLNNLCLAGGVALNCVANGRILRETPFKKVWIQPASGDAGGSLGAALFVWYQLLENERHANDQDGQMGSLLGPGFSEGEVRRYLDSMSAPYECLPEEQALCEKVAGFIEDQKVVGWFQGRMEFGPRALGCRSILGDARSETMQRVMNVKIKFRESFRPFAPAVLRSRVDDFFAMEPGYDSPYMLLVADVNCGKRTDCLEQLIQTDGFEKLTIRKSVIPAVTHVDFSARVQTVDRQRHNRFHMLLESLDKRCDCPIVINTSFNVRGEPIVCSPEDAYRCFMATDMDVLVMENCVLLKKDQPKENRVSSDSHLAQFELD